MTTTLGTSNLRGSSRQTRTNPTRTSKTIGSSLRQNSLISNPPVSTHGPSETHGFYPVISHFADAIAALPRDFRRHTSLLKEVDAKAWLPEESLQSLLTRCLAENPPKLGAGNPQSIAGATMNMTDEVAVGSATNSVVGVPLDNVSQYSNQSTDPTTLQRRQLFAALRHNLMQIMVTMDEKNHVINNANEELSRHLRRLGNVWPHIVDEISEETRLGSLKHWAYTETNPSKKVTAAATTRRDPAAGLAIMHDSEIAHRSESRREAMLAKKQRLNQHIDSDIDDPRVTNRKTLTNSKRRGIDSGPETIVLAGSGTTAGESKKKKQEKAALPALGLERVQKTATGGRTMSREPSQQDNASKKRKAPGSVSTIARKRLNANAQGSPKLASSPLAGTFGKDAHKRSPVLSAIPARARQNATRNNLGQTNDGSRGRPSSSTSHRAGNGNGGAGSTPELNHVTSATSRTAADVKNMKETNIGKGDRLADNDVAIAGPNGLMANRSGLSMERSASKQGNVNVEPATSDENVIKAAESPLLSLSLSLATTEYRPERTGRARASKTSTPVVGTFADSEVGDLAGFGGNGNGNGKLRRPTRPRMKDHGLHDSLSPKGLPVKRSHKKGAGTGNQQITQRLKDEADAATSASPVDLASMEDEDEENAGEDEERYCYCNNVSYGEMVACDNKDCPREWFHLECIGLKSVPKSAKWYCEECKETFAKKGKSNGGGGGGGGGNGNGHGK